MSKLPAKPKATAKPATRAIEEPGAITVQALFDAYEEGLHRVQNDLSLSAATTSVGTILEPGKKGDQHGVQVFVKVIRYSDAWLKRAPHNGGLSVRP